MSITAAQLYANVSVTGAGQSVAQLGAVSTATDKAMTKFSVLGRTSAGAAKGVTQIAGGLVKVGEWAAAALGVATIASAHTAASFQADMELIRTQAGASQTEVDNMTKSVQDLVHSVGTAPDELAKSLYHIESVGLRGAAALDVLRASAIGAKVGLADTESVSNALTAVWFSGIRGAKSMTDAMAILDGIVGVGNMHLQDLTDSFRSGILGTAATFGIDIRSLGAAIATLTDAGVPAQIAATRLNMTISHMAAPVPNAIKALKGIGITQFQLANDLHKPDGLFVAFQDLHAALMKAGEIYTSGPLSGHLTPQGTNALTKIFGGSRFGATAMQLITDMDRVGSKYSLVEQRSNTFAGNVQATMQTAGFAWSQFIADLKESSLSFGTGVLPSLVHALHVVDDALVAHRADFVKFGQDMGHAIDGGIAELQKIDWHAVEDGLSIVRTSVGGILDIVKMIPPQITVAFAGMVGINKLAGGLLGKGAGNILGAGIQQLLGRGSVTNPMWVRMIGGIPGVGVPGGGAGTGSSLLGTVAKVFLVGAAAGVAAELWDQRSQQAQQNAQAESDLTNQTSAFAGGATLGDINQSLAGLNKYMNDLNNSWSPEGIAYAFNFDGVRDSLNKQRDILQGEQTYLARASAEGWGIQRTDSTKPTDLAAATIAKLGAVVVGSEAEKKHRQAIINADRAARHATSVHPSSDPLVRQAVTLLHQLSFLRGGSAGAKDVAVANDIALGSGSLSISQLTQAIEGVGRDINSLPPKFHRPLAIDLQRLQTELARKQAQAAKDAAAKEAAAARAAGILTAAAIRDKELSVTVNPGTVNFNVAGKTIVSAMVQWSPTRQARNV